MPNILTPAELAEIRQLDKARTQGEWRAGKPQWRRYGPPYKTPISSPNGTIANVLDHDADLHPKSGGYIPKGTPCKDIAFIAACSVAVPKMLATIKAQSEVIRAWDAWCSSPGSICDSLGEAATELMTNEIIALTGAVGEK